jgi:hypothetical protein
LVLDFFAAPPLSAPPPDWVGLAEVDPVVDVSPPVVLDAPDDGEKQTLPHGAPAEVAV